LRDNLRGEGVPTEEPFAEDWGWVVPIANDDFGLWIGCGHYLENEDGYPCFIEPHTPFVRKFFRTINTPERVAALQQALDKILTEDVGIHSKQWWTHEEFN